MPRTGRILELLELLQSAGLRSVPELASRLEVDERTVRRDVEMLRDLGIPVESTRGRGGGYRIGAGYRMPPLMLTDSEATAVLVGLVQAASAGIQGSDAAATLTATAKVRRSIPRRLTERADALLDVVAWAPVDTRGDGTAADPETLLIIASAVKNRQPLDLQYRNRDGGPSRRSVQPHDLVARGGRWYLTGLDAVSQDVRSFRVDRIASVTILRGTFPSPATHDPAADLVDRFATADYRYRVVLRVRAGEVETSRHLPPTIARLDPVGDGWLRVTINAESLTWIPQTLLALPADVIVEQPEALRAELTAAAERLHRMATT